MIEYGIFSLKTNCCGPKDLFTYRPFTREDNNNDDNDDDEDEKMERSPGSGGFINSNHGNVLVMTALRILQNGITRRSNCMDSKSVIIFIYFTLNFFLKILILLKILFII